jgi:plasmid maintenance system antidote protein VapI
MNTRIAELIRELEEDSSSIMEEYCAGRKKKDVAAELGVEPALITMIVKGKRKISKQVILRMATHAR